MRDCLMMRDMARAYEGVIMNNIEKVKADVAKVNELFNNFYIKQTYCFEGECMDNNCLEFNEENCRIYAEIGLPYALGFFFGDYDNLKDFVDELVKRIEIIDVKEIAEENCNDKLDDPYNMDFPNIEKEMAEVTDIKRQLLQFCEVLKSFVKGL